MLDLTKYKNDYYEIKWFDGEVLKLKKPTQQLLMRITSLEQLSQEEQFNAFVDIISDVLNSNTAGRVFTADDLMDMDLQIIQAILQDYIASIYKQLGE